MFISSKAVLHMGHRVGLARPGADFAGPSQVEVSPLVRIERPQSTEVYRT